jgi:Fungal chitosanase of glycosyl hydrolase group 75/Carbohydrate binding module (family 35)/Carbohydrate binding module (family 6)
MRRRSLAILGVTVALIPLLQAVPAHAAPVRYEAESAMISQGVVESNHLNFSGTGFVNNDNVVGSFTEWTVNAASAGSATLIIRYANGTTTARPADVSVNGTVISAALSFGSTTNWDTWANKTLTNVALNAGSNTVRVTATSASGPPNLDFLDVDLSTTQPATVYQAEGATIVQGLVESNHTGFTGTGFVNYNNVSGSYVEFSVTPEAAGSATLTFRYSNGTTTNRPMSITVNGTVVNSGLAFNGTGNWDTWADASVPANLNAGANTVRATATTANGGPNLDKLTLGTGGGGGAPTAAELLAKVTTCSQISNGKYKTDSETAATIAVCQKTGAVFWKADMDIDCDGIRTAQCNENTDCCFLPDTFCHSSTDNPLNAAQLPYVVVPSPSSIWNYTNFQIGCGTVVAVIFNNQVLYAVVGDTGPTAIIGEASYATANSLGINPDPSNGGTDSGVTYIVFQGSQRVSPIENHNNAVTLGQQLARTFVNNN